MKTYIVISMLAVVSGCSQNSVAQTPETTKPVNQKPKFTIMSDKSVKPELVLQKSLLQGALIQDGHDFTLTATNASVEDINLIFRSGKRGDIALFNSQGQQIWRWSTGKMFTQALAEVELNVGHSTTIKFTIPDDIYQHISQGDYLVATLNSMPIVGEKADMMTPVKYKF
ncbi:BsuPI-related putative proteinase inhibitor [Shewanella marina]|uniref:BsuPI-related putative proteinase inhibitor n=1 Tax=Shewanella marina TaxID=487319 RepID=UPI00131F0FBA|nr:BsuPI-related putative proteinase inhibitor [Shewanella marina]